MAKITEAKRKANKKWDEKNKSRKNYITRRSNAKGFILNMATEEDLTKLESYIRERHLALSSNNEV